MHISNIDSDKPINTQNSEVKTEDKKTTNTNKAIPIVEEEKKDNNAPVEGYSITKTKKDNEKNNNSAQENEHSDLDIINQTSNHITNLLHSANNAYSKFAKIENNNTNDRDLENDTNTILNASRITETIENIDDAGKRHLSFLSEKAPESGNVSGALNVYYETGSEKVATTFLGNVENRWQNQNKNIYTKFNATYGHESIIISDSAERSNKIVGNVTFDGRLDVKNFVYGAGAEFDSFSNNTQILDVHVAAKHKLTNIGADLTKRTTFTIDDTTGKRAIVSNMKLKINLLSNDKADENTYTPFKFDSESSPLPSEAVNADTEAKNDAQTYIKTDRKEGVDVKFDYDENVCGFTVNYNHNFYDNGNKVLSLAPVAGIHDYTDPTLSDNNESLKMTYGLIAQTGKNWSNGQVFKGTVSAVGHRIVKKGSSPFDTRYILANLTYTNNKAKFNAEIDAGMIKSGDINLEYADIYASKQFKNSSIGVTAGISKYNISGNNENLFSCMATYKYNIPYKTKK